MTPPIDARRDSLHAGAAVAPARDDLDHRIAASVRRLEGARAQLIGRLDPSSAGDGRQRSTGDSWLHALAASRWLEPIAPIIESARSTAHRWWRRHPWRPTLEVAGQAWRDEASPWIARHPLVAMGAAAAAGAWFVHAAPWRWPAAHRAIAVAGRRVRRWALVQMGRPAAQLMLAGALAAAVESNASREPRSPRSGATAGSSDGH